MKHIIDPIVKTTSDVTEVAKRIVEDGVEFFRGTLGKLPLFSSVIARESKENITHDETHYFLVPYRLSEVNYALYTQRVLPEGVGPENDLPKAKIFHLPAVGTLDTLEKLLFEQLSAKHRQQYSNELPIADRLDLIAKEIDKQSNLVTGGLVLIGGAVAIANPLVGVGIAAKALLPTLGSKLSKHGINHVTDWLRDKKRQSSDKAANAQAKKEIKQLAAKVETNDTLALLEEALATTDPDHDPNIAFANMMNTPEQASDTILTCSAIACVYHDCLEKDKLYSQAHLHPADITWLKSVCELAQSTS